MNRVNAAMKWVTITAQLLLTSCSVFSPDNIDSARDAVKTFDDLAEVGCQIFYGDTYGISLEDAARIYCTDKHVKEFRDRFFSGAQAAGAAIGAAPPDEQ